MNGNFRTEEECKTDCDWGYKCWGFAYKPSEFKCVIYDQIDDPFYIENNKVDSSGETLYMKRCNFERKIFEFNIFLLLFSLPKKKKKNK